jgi:large-conductance mechanosensitive channel
MRMYAPEQVPEHAGVMAEPQVQRVNWWLRLTSSGWDKPQRTIQERERARRSRLTAWLVLGLLVTDLLLLPTSIGNPGTLLAIFVAGVGLVVAIVLNRSGVVTGAGILIVLLICGATLGAVATVPGGLNTVNLPVYDLLAIAVVVGASVLPRAAGFVVAIFSVGLICLDFYLQPHAAELDHDIAAVGALSMLVRPVALQVILAVVSYLWVRGTDEAIRRADRAEELAAMEHQMAEQKRQLDVGIRQILETHVRVANGDFSARAPTSQDNVLFQIAASLNNLLNRLGRAAQSEHLLQRTVAEIGRLRESLLAAKTGRPPLWPTRTGTPVDSLIEVLAEPPMRPGASAQLSSAASPSGPRGGAGGTGGLGFPPTAPFPMRGGASGPLPPPLAPGFGAPMPGQQGQRPDPGGYGEPGPMPAGGTSNAPSNNPWALPDMPPLPDWLKPEDPNSRG